MGLPVDEDRGASDPRPFEKSSPSQVNGWQPIETAPRDGRTVLLNRDGSQRVYTGRYATAGKSGFWIDTHGQQRDPTSWMPLPPPPSES